MLDGIQIDPVAFTIPIGDGFAVYWYGIIITIGIIIASLWGSREIERRGQSADDFINGLLIAVLSGYFFARITYVILDALGGNGDRYDSFFDIINSRAGGVNILGGFIGASVIVLFYAKWRRLRIWDYADVAGMVILLAQAIGRWANFVNQELYGPPTDLPWGILINPGNRLPQYAQLSTDTRFHPTFLYESILLFIGFFLLRWLNNRYRDQWQSGTIFSLFLIWWGGERFIIEFFRPDQTTIGDTPFTYSMLLAAGIVAVGVYLFLVKTGRVQAKRKKRRVVKPKVNRS